MIVAVTGATGNIGTALIRRLLKTNEVSEVVALGRRCPPNLENQVRFVNWELGQPWPGETIGLADVLVHSAFIMEDTEEQSEALEANVAGTLRLISSAAANGVGHTIFVSSANAYGLQSGPQLLTECEPIRDAPNHFYLHHKFLCETAIAGFSAVDPDTIYTVARPCMVVGAGMSNSALEALTAKTLVYPRPKHSYYQFISVDDVADALTQILLKRKGGIFNLAPDNCMTVREIADTQGNRVVGVPVWLANKLSDIGFRLGLIPYSSRWITLGDPPISGQRTRHVLGWSPQKNTQDALKEALM